MSEKSHLERTNYVTLKKNYRKELNISYLISNKEAYKKQFYFNKFWQKY